ncbi:MAG: alanine and proline-rich secreted protein Apa [Firmicutes bacterium]|nr:alanine and proline-rich secreted protein Apa [Bacillota bacterium]
MERTEDGFIAAFDNEVPSGLAPAPVLPREKCKSYHERQRRAIRRRRRRGMMLAFMFVLNVALVGVMIWGNDGPTLIAGGTQPPTWQSADMNFAPWGSTYTDGGFRGVNNDDETMSTVGTAANPLAITSAHDLARLAFLVNGDLGVVTSGRTFEGVYFRVVEDINLSSRIWVPIGGPSRPFMGNFDGGSRRITMPRTMRAQSVIGNTSRDFGLFGRVCNACISNITITETTIDTWQGKDTGEVRIGSVIGFAENSTVSNILNMAHMVVNTSNFSTFVGGVVGVSLRTAAEPVSEMFNIANHGNITVPGVHSVGGVVGRMGNPNYLSHSGEHIVSSTIFNAYNMGSIGVGQLSGVGGLGGIVGDIVMMRRAGTDWGTSNPIINLHNVFNVGELSVANSPTNVRMNQIHGWRNLMFFSMAGYAGNVTNWILNVDRAFGVRADFAAFTPLNRFIQNRSNVGQVAPNGATSLGQPLIDVMRAGNHQINDPRVAEWTAAPGTPNMATFHFATGAFGNLRLHMASEMFDVELSSHSANAPSGPVVVGSQALPSPSQSLLPSNVEFVGWATSQSLANEGVVAHAVGTTVTIASAATELFAVYRFFAPITLTLQIGDGVLATTLDAPEISLTRPNAFGTALARRTLPLGATHVGWARSAEAALRGTVEVPLQTTPTAAFTTDTTLYGVWERYTPAQVIIIRTNGALGINMPTVMEEFRSAVGIIDLALRVPAPQQGFTLRGWAHNATEAAAGAVRIAPTETLRVTSTTRLYAVWPPLDPNFVDPNQPTIEPWPTVPGLMPSRPPAWNTGDEWPSGFPYAPPAGWRVGDPWPGPQPMRLAAPTSLNIVGEGFLMWESVADGSGYQIMINDAPWTSILYNFIDLSFFAPGTYRIRIMAIGGDWFMDSVLSLETRFVVGGVMTEVAPADLPEPPPPTEPPPIGKERLCTPQSLRRVGGGAVATWNAVNNANSYAIYLNGVQIATSATNHFELEYLGVIPGIHIISVRAIAADGSAFVNSSLSMGTLFSVEPPPPLNFTSMSTWWLNEIIILSIISLLVIAMVSLFFIIGRQRRANNVRTVRG